MPSPKWRSLLLRPSSVCRHVAKEARDEGGAGDPSGNIIGTDDDLRSAILRVDRGEEDCVSNYRGCVTVPHGGLYGLCFGTEVASYERLRSSLAEEGGVGRKGWCKCNCVVRFWAKDGEQMEIGLPLTAEKGDPAKPRCDGGCGKGGRPKGSGSDGGREAEAEDACEGTVHDERSDGNSNGSTPEKAAVLGRARNGGDTKDVTIVDKTHRSAKDCTVENEAGEAGTLTSMHIGRLVYLPAETRVSVVRVSPPCQTSWKKEPSDSDSEYLSGSPSCSIRWSLVLHQKLASETYAPGCLPDKKRPRNDSSNTSGKLTAASVVGGNKRTIELHPKEAWSKPLLCAQCGRKFPSVKSVVHHVQSSHGSKMNETKLGRAGSVTVGWTGPAILRKPLEVVHDDEVMSVVVKPQGVSVMGERWTLSRSDLFLALKAGPDSDQPLRKPRAVHRLDSPTGGLLVVAKTFPAEVQLKKCFSERTCQKRYRAIVFGKLDPSEKHADNDTPSLAENSVSSLLTRSSYLGGGIVDSVVGGKPALTRYEIVSHTRCPHPHANGWLTTVDLFPFTGRKHQLRRHLKVLGHPIWGDGRYGPYGKPPEQMGTVRGGDDETNLAHRVADKRGAVPVQEQSPVCSSDADLLASATVERFPHIKLCLWALEIGFPHPTTGANIVVSMEEPSWFVALRNDQERRWILSRASNGKDEVA